MKFEEHLLNYAVPEWQSKYINYQVKNECIFELFYCVTISVLDCGVHDTCTTFAWVQ